MTVRVPDTAGDGDGLGNLGHDSAHPSESLVRQLRPSIVGLLDGKLLGSGS